MSSNWDPKPLSIFLNKVIGGGTPSRKIASYWEGEIPWASVKDFQDDIHLLYDTAEHISFEGLEKSAANLIPPEVLVICVRMAIGRVALTTQPTAINQDIKAIDTNDLLIPKYLLYLLLIHRLQLEAVSTGSTVKGLRLKQLLLLPLRVPLPSVQHQIITILDTIDEQIQHTEQLISKLKLLRDGLLHKLLTCGIDEHGQLRDPVAHPEQFKETRVDKINVKIPKEWEISKLGDKVIPNGGFIQTGPFGSQLHAHEYVPEGVPVIMPQDIQNGHINKSQIARIPPTKALTLARHFVKINDVILGRRGDLDRCAFIDTSEVGAICGTDCLLIRPPQKLIDGRWLADIYRHNYSQSQMRAGAVGSTMVGLNTRLLMNLVIAMPSLKEQNSIMDRCSSIDILIHGEEAYYTKLKNYKTGLMHDLLTGKVRVAEKQEEVESCLEG